MSYCDGKSGKKVTTRFFTCIHIQDKYLNGFLQCLSYYSQSYTYSTGGPLNLVYAVRWILTWGFIVVTFISYRAVDHKDKTIWGNREQQQVSNDQAGFSIGNSFGN